MFKQRFVKAPIHLMWMGKAPTPENAGMDTIAVDLIRQQHPEQDVIFYCLDSEKERYQQYFDKRNPSPPKVQVRGIESYVQSLGEIKHDFQSSEYPDDLAKAFETHIHLIKRREAGLVKPKDKIR